MSVAHTERLGSDELVSYDEDFDVHRFLTAIEEGRVKIGFDASTGHNHSTKFRIRSVDVPTLYDTRIAEEEWRLQ